MPYSAVVLVLVLVLVVALLQSPLLSAPRGNAFVHIGAAGPNFDISNWKCP